MADDATLTISKSGGQSDVDVILTKVSHNSDKMLVIQPLPSGSDIDTKTMVVDLQFGQEAVTFNGILRDVYSGAAWDLGLAKKNRLLGMFRETVSLWTCTWGASTREQVVTGIPSKFEITELPGGLQGQKAGQIATTETSNKVFELTFTLIRTANADIMQMG